MSQGCELLLQIGGQLCPGWHIGIGEPSFAINLDAPSVRLTTMCAAASAGSAMTGLTYRHRRAFIGDQFGCSSAGSDRADISASASPRWRSAPVAARRAVTGLTYRHRCAFVGDQLRLQQAGSDRADIVGIGEPSLAISCGCSERRAVSGLTNRHRRAFVGDQWAAGRRAVAGLTDRHRRAFVGDQLRCSRRAVMSGLTDRHRRAFVGDQLGLHWRAMCRAGISASGAPSLGSEHRWYCCWEPRWQGR